MKITRKEIAEIRKLVMSQKLTSKTTLVSDNVPLLKKNGKSGKLFIKPAVDVILLSGRSMGVIIRAEAPGKGLLALPGGMVDKGESETKAARRELQEETGYIHKGKMKALSKRVVDREGKLDIRVAFADFDGLKKGDTFVVSTRFFVATAKGEATLVGSSDARTAKFVSFADIAKRPEKKFSFPDHKRHMLEAIQAHGSKVMSSAEPELGMSISDKSRVRKIQKKKREKKFEKLGYYELVDLLKNLGFRILAKQSSMDLLAMTRKRSGVRSDAVVVYKDQPHLTLRSIIKTKGDFIEYLIEAEDTSYSKLWSLAEQKFSVMLATRQGRKLAKGEMASASQSLSTSNYSDVRLPELSRQGYMKRGLPNEDDVVDVTDTAWNQPRKNDAFTYLAALVTIGHEHPNVVAENLLKKLGVKFARNTTFSPETAVNYAVKSGFKMKEIESVARKMWKGNPKCQRS